jgi:hypothetical protein
MVLMVLQGLRVQVVLMVLQVVQVLQVLVLIGKVDGFLEVHIIKMMLLLGVVVLTLRLLR